MQNLHVLNSTTEGMCNAAFLNMFFAEPKICQLHMTMSVEKDVFWLQIPESTHLYGWSSSRLRNVWTNHLYIYLPLRPCFQTLGTMLSTRLQQFMKGCAGTCWDQSAAKKYFLDNLYTINTNYDTIACTVKAKFVSAPVQ